MAANEGDIGSTRTITAAEPPGPASTPSSKPSEREAVAEQNSQSTEAVSQAVESVPPGSGSQLADLIQCGPEEQSIVVGADFTDLGNTTIIYVQPDGSLEGSGLTPEEQQALLEQLTKQQIVQVSDTEAAQLLQQGPLVKTIPVHNTALDPNQLQQVINQVTKSQQQVMVPQQPMKQQVQVTQQSQKQQVQVPQQSVKPQKPVQILQKNLKTGTQNNASQQLKSVAQQFVMQTGSPVQGLQKKVSQIHGLVSSMWTLVESPGPSALPLRLQFTKVWR